MNVDDFRDYYVPAVVNIMGDIDPTKPFRLYSSEFDAMLGVNTSCGFFTRYARDDYPLPDELKALLTALAGPHGKAVLKAYRIQKGLEL